MQVLCSQYLEHARHAQQQKPNVCRDPENLVQNGSVLYVVFMVHDLMDKVQMSSVEERMPVAAPSVKGSQTSENYGQKRSEEGDGGVRGEEDYVTAQEQQVAESAVQKASAVLDEPSQTASLTLPDLNSKDHPSYLPPPSSPLPLPLPLSLPLPNPNLPSRPSIYTTNTTACLLTHQHEDLSPSDPELEHLIHLYRTELTPRFPFVVLELRPGMSGKEWMAENPLLGKAVVMAASYYNLPRQTRLDVQIVREIAERMLVQGEKTLEGLQAILVFCAWWVGFLGMYQYQCLNHPQLNNLLSIAVGIIGHLGLNKPPTSDKFRYPFGSTSRSTSTERNMHHRRALAGVSTGFQRLDAMKYPVYLDECCRVIAEEKQFETDALLLEMVKITDLAERIGSTIHMAQRESEMNVPVALLLGGYMGELKALRAGIPGEWKDNSRFCLLVCLVVDSRTPPNAPHNRLHASLRNRSLPALSFPILFKPNPAFPNPSRSSPHPALSYGKLHRSHPLPLHGYISRPPAYSLCIAGVCADDIGAAFVLYGGVGVGFGGGEGEVRFSVGVGGGGGER
ncbi:C6 transcription factor protein [Rutstroemia sp. NJR-2017a BBW]|nr:C6 transcription factor protein [Rutstroemia sp. NJR-2017a BBW]